MTDARDSWGRRPSSWDDSGEGLDRSTVMEKKV